MQDAVFESKGGALDESVYHRGRGVAGGRHRNLAVSSGPQEARGSGLDGRGVLAMSSIGFGLLFAALAFAVAGVATIFIQ